MSAVDNQWYDQLGDEWWDPAGRVRALHEINPVRCTYFFDALERLDGQRVLDLGCGAGLMTERYAAAGVVAVGLDQSRPSLAAGRRHAAGGSASPRYVAGRAEAPRYVAGRAEALPFPDASFDAVCSADALEHVDDLPAVLDECVRVLRPGGRFVFDTINRTWFSRLVMIWAAQNLLRFAPPRTHAFDRFIRPAELRTALEARGLIWRDLRGLSLRRHPLVAAWRYAVHGDLGGFVLSSDTRVSYLGYAEKPRLGEGT